MNASVSLLAFGADCGHERLGDKGTWLLEWVVEERYRKRFIFAVEYVIL
jgi:hypothetical protein